jgi:hypothetical protein
MQYDPRRSQTAGCAAPPRSVHPGLWKTQWKTLIMQVDVNHKGKACSFHVAIKYLFAGISAEF